MARSRPKATASGPRSPRQLRVGEEIRHALAAVIGRGELRDPELRGLAITVSEVRVSADLRHATAFVLPLGGAAVEVIVKALTRAAPFLRGEVARAINLRHAPEIVFVPDTSFDYASRIDATLRRPEVRRDLGRDSSPDDERD